MRVVAESCRDDNCPRLVVDDDTGQVYVQGAAVRGWPSVSLGPGESVVAISRNDFDELLAQYRKDES